MKEKDRYIILSGKQIKDTHNQSQSFLSVQQICDLLNKQDERIKEFAEQVKMAFYVEFDELIPSIMANRINELLKEYEK